MMGDGEVDEKVRRATTSSPALQGERVSFTGTLASMTHAQAQEFVEQQGGIATAHVSRQTTLLVVGEEGWPLEDDGQPSVKLRQVTLWRSEGLDIRIINESEWLRLVGLDHRQQEVHRLYTPAMLSQMLDVSVHLIRRWERRGLIHAVRKTYRLPYFDFQEVNSARRLCDLLKAGVSPQKLETSLSQLQDVLADPGRPFAQLNVLVHGTGIVYRDRVGWMEPATGQRLFEFASVDTMPCDEPIGDDGDRAPATLSIPSGTDQLDWTFQDWYEQGCRLLEENQATKATEAFRLCLMEQPTSPEIHFYLAEALYRSENRLGALERYHVVVELDHEYIEAWTQLGCVHAELKEPEAALDAFEIALKTHPEFPDALFHKAQALDQMSRIDEAVPCWQKYLEFDVRGPWADTARQRLEEARVGESDLDQSDNSCSNRLSDG